MALFTKKTYTELELVEGCAANDRRFQEAFYRRFFPEMLRMCRRYTRDDDQAMEILNAGFLRVFQKIGTFEHRGSLEGWVRRLVWHALADHFKAQKRHVHFLIFEERDEQVAARGLENFYTDDLLRLVSTLPPATQRVFNLFAIEGFSHLEIGAEMGISEGTSKWHLNHARSLLKKLIAQQNAHFEQHFTENQQRHVG